ncbi:MAG: hypothetical protein D6689_09505 [Deltaproteobacteria bacterium]|nr:MAG: hypothetical protein D6689_09505 [Deltaproteobacteria bacterium]
MRCRDVQRLATRYVDGELDARRASAVRGHARVCSVCNELLAREAAVRDAVASLDAAVDPPPELWDRIAAQVAAEEIADARRSRVWLWWQAWRRPVTAAAAVVAVAVAVAAAVAWRGRPAPLADAPRVVAAAPAPAAVTVEDQFRDELVRAEARYRRAADELRAIAAEVRREWDADRSAAFDRALADHERRLRAARRAVVAGADPRGHDALFAAYRDEIEFLSEHALAGGPP